MNSNDKQKHDNYYNEPAFKYKQWLFFVCIVVVAVVVTLRAHVAVDLWTDVCQKTREQQEWDGKSEC